MFGKIVNNEMTLNDYGKIVYEELFLSAKIRNEIRLYENEFVIMANHIHRIIILNEKISIIGANVVGAKDFSPLHNNRLCGTHRTIGSIVRGFKIGCTKWFRKHTDIYTVWQRNYYEHIIRNEIELNKIREYILNNPLNWEIDENYRI
jgi:REP element-mobilizing transposase RayT